IPVYSNFTGLHYANYYCALCEPGLYKAWINGTDEVITVPIHSMKCSKNVTLSMLRKYGVYQKGKLMWKVGSGFCAMYTHTKRFKSGRPCVPSISTCPPGTDPELAAKCAAYSLLISETNKVYRNPHCALCNGVRKSNMFCKYRHNDFILPSLSEIFTFDWSFNACNFPENMRWDGFNKKCTAIHCPIGGQCKVTMCQDKNCLHPKHVFGRIIDGYLTYASLSISVVCLLIHVYLAIFISPPKNLPSKVINSLAWSLLIAQTLFLCGIYSLVSLPYLVCYIIAVTIQFFFLASFFWMNVISFDIFHTFSDSSLKNYSTKSYTKYALWSWGGAAFITAVSIAADLTSFIPDIYRPQYTVRHNVCWFGNWVGMGLFFFFPILITNLLNLVLFIITICMFRKMQCSTHKITKSRRKEYNRLWLYIKLSTMMGTMWAVGILTSISNKPDYHMAFTILNGLQGAFIFIMFDLKITAIFNYFELIAFKFLSVVIKGKKKALVNNDGNHDTISSSTISSSIVSE
ncbi:G-protein coupled receptor Mth2, partial [Halyomorpha halys]|uniref:G-protein coupled receptor Mth2 n=1 Tax=Halyomorpha halys TaxID=286706 RepID=UPI0034D265B5